MTAPVARFSAACNVFVDSDVGNNYRPTTRPIELQIRLPQPHNDKIFIYSHPPLQNTGNRRTNSQDNVQMMLRLAHPSSLPLQKKYFMEQRHFRGISAIRFGSVPPIPSIVIACISSTPTQLREIAHTIVRLTEYYEVVQNITSLLDTRTTFINEEKSLERSLRGKNSQSGSGIFYSRKIQVSPMRLGKMVGEKFGSTKKRLIYRRWKRFQSQSRDHKCVHMLSISKYAPIAFHCDSKIRKHTTKWQEKELTTGLEAVTSGSATVGN